MQNENGSLIDTHASDMLRWICGGRELCWHLPAFPIDGRSVTPSALLKKTETPDGLCCEYALTAAVSLCVEIKTYGSAPIVRLRYTLAGKGCFTTVDREKPIRYGSLCGKTESVTEIQLSNFDRINHTFKPVIERYDDGLQWGRTLIGPIVLAKDANGVRMVAYEHGAEAPDHFLCFESEVDELRLVSVKGNYFCGQPYTEYASPWILLGLADDETAMQKAYRQFVLRDLCPDPASREPRIFYNTWNNQERDKYFDHKPYLTAMTQEHMLQEIDVAHAMGIETFVMDTGWYQKTGDWEVNLQRFPDGLHAIREKLEGYGMKLGLWFNPIVAAQTAYARREHPEWTIEKDGKEAFCGKIWETEESYSMCLVSDYADYFIEQLVRLHETLGVSYFKWDAIGQYGCDCDHHHHGTQANSREERLDSYAYQMGLRMIYVAEEVSRRCPGVIVDFDVTEGGRFVGLGFLSVGKYFLINNGPYFSSFDIPKTVAMEPDTINVFFYPGAARPQVCRAFTQFDPWIPSTLFLTHFLPEGTERDRNNSKSALVLGGNGIWGDLLHLKQEEIDDWKTFLDLYKQVRQDAANADPITRGWAGSSPEIHEKIDAQSGRGLVSFFCRTGGTFTHITRRLSKAPEQVVGADAWHMRSDGRLELTVNLEDNDARTVFVL